MNPKHPETRRALEAVARALKACGDAQEAQEQLTMIATVAICMIHGTYGKKFCREYLNGALAELDLAEPMKIALDIVDARRTN